MKSKKGVELPFNVIAIVIIVLIVIVITIYVFNNIIGKQESEITNLIPTAEFDHDRDGIPDSIDKCPCDSNNDCEPLSPGKTWPCLK